jgi:Trypsin-like peptidase domain
MSAAELLHKVDPLSFVSVRIDQFYNEKSIGAATGFFYHGLFDGKPNYWLVTNWHVLTGRNVDDPSVCPHEIPNRLRLRLIVQFDQPEYQGGPEGQFLMQEQFIELFDSDQQAMWYQHPRKNALDVAVLNAAPLVDRFHLRGVNEVENATDMAVQIGNQVFVLGYPLGFSHFMNAPIWKRGSIGSEPHLETVDSKGRVVIDATTRGGMSGAPVFMREKTHYLAENGDIKTQANATRFIGIYASRPNIAAPAGLIEEDRRAEIGFFYKSSCILETITNGVRGPNFSECP